MNKKIDCRNMACPQPVLETKKALEEMDEGILEVLVNSISSVQNVKRYAINNGFEPKVEELGNGETLITIVKGYECAIVADEDNEKFLNKTIFIKHDRVGEGELGDILMKGFLKTTLEFKKLPKNIIFVNRGVFLTTKGDEEMINILKKFERRGVKIYSCGLCMNYYKIPPEELKVGEIGNAYDTMDVLLHTEVVSL